ncbi:hypothetical protein ABPG77_008342 [Micractinium sp. CCAP 211/92]
MNHGATVAAPADARHCAGILLPGGLPSVAMAAAADVDQPSMRRSLAAPALVVAVIGLTTLLLAVGGSPRWRVESWVDGPCSSAPAPSRRVNGPGCQPQRTAAYAQALQTGRWVELFEQRCDPSPLTPFCEWETAHEWSWCYQPCQARQYSREQVSALFTRKRVAAVSDSHARNLFSELARAVLGDQGDDFVRLLAEQHHDDHSHRWDSATGDVAPNATNVDSQLDFYWQTDMAGIAGVVDQMRVNDSLPDVVLLSSGSWYIVGDDHGYPPLNQSLASFQADMQQLRAAIDRANEQADHDILWLWLAIPPRVKGRAQWASWMVRAADIPHLNQAAKESGLMQPTGPAFYLDLDRIATECLLWCNADGSHVSEPVNRLLVQLIANLAAAPPAA